ncbi:MAG: TIGR00266 family protein [Deltaproteobacteria bacterium]|nr:MAG: TIGR00266 family protein [Deltaproteobacteria bacterium]
MQHEIRNKPDFASLHVLLDEGEAVVTEAGAMMGMDPALKMDTNMQGGIFGAAKRALGGESVFLNTYTGTGAGQRLDVAPSQPGDMEHIPVSGAVVVQRGSYLASTPGIEVSAKWGGAKTFFGGEGLIMLRCEGQGDLWISSYGAIHQVDVQGGYTVDTSHIVAFDESLTFQVRKSGGLKSLFFSSEGLVCQFSGTGRLWIQTRNAPALAGFLHPFRRVQNKN